METIELKGYKSLRALNVYHTLMLGVKMLPAYRGEVYEDFYQRLKELPAVDQEKIIREGALFVQLDEDEVKALICFVKDPNGVPYTEENLKNLSADQIFEAIVAVCLQISKIKVSFVSESEKKK